MAVIRPPVIATDWIRPWTCALVSNSAWVGRGITRPSTGSGRAGRLRLRICKRANALKAGDGGTAGSGADPEEADRQRTAVLSELQAVGLGLADLRRRLAPFQTHQRPRIALGPQRLHGALAP